MTTETSKELRLRLAAVAVELLAEIENGQNKADATMKALPIYQDRIEFFFMLDNLHPDRLVAMRMVVEAYQKGTPLPKVGGVTLF